MKKNKQFIQYGIMIGLAVIVVIAIVFFFINNSEYKMPAKGFQVVAGEKNVFDKGTAFVFGQNGSTYKGADDNEYLNGTPIYFDKDKSTIVIPKDSVYVNGRQAIFKKALAFKTINDKKGIFYDENINLDGGFIYDGVNGYTFLEKMTLNVNGKNVELGPLSSIDLSDSGVFFYYNTADDSLAVDNLYGTECTATCNDYSVDLLNDIFYTANSEKVLLYTKVDSLDELK